MDEINTINIEKISLDENRKNKGIGAGGKNTNLKGKNFEEITDLQLYLNDYIKYTINDTKYGYFLQKILNKGEENETFYTFMYQSGLKSYFKKYYDIEFFRHPDEAFIVQNQNFMNIYIMEKRNNPLMEVLKLNYGDVLVLRGNTRLY